MTKHVCPDGTVRAGDELDCSFCRADLLRAFHAPVALPEDTGHTMTVGRAFEPGTPHVTWSDTTPNEVLPGGSWEAGCSCGWIKYGTYSRRGTNRNNAVRLAQAWADKHRENPWRDQ